MGIKAVVNTLYHRQFGEYTAAVMKGIVEAYNLEALARFLYERGRRYDAGIRLAQANEAWEQLVGLVISARTVTPAREVS